MPRERPYYIHISRHDRHDVLKHDLLCYFYAKHEQMGFSGMSPTGVEVFWTRYREGPLLVAQDRNNGLGEIAWLTVDLKSVVIQTNIKVFGPHLREILGPYLEAYPSALTPEDLQVTLGDFMDREIEKCFQYALDPQYTRAMQPILQGLILHRIVADKNGDYLANVRRLHAWWLKERKSPWISWLRHGLRAWIDRIPELDPADERGLEAFFLGLITFSGFVALERGPFDVEQAVSYDRSDLDRWHRSWVYLWERCCQADGRAEWHKNYIDLVLKEYLPTLRKDRKRFQDRLGAPYQDMLRPLEEYLPEEFKLDVAWTADPDAFCEQVLPKLIKWWDENRAKVKLVKDAQKPSGKLIEFRPNFFEDLAKQLKQETEAKAPDGGHGDGDK